MTYFFKRHCKSLADICMVIDLDGFRIDGVFYTREFGYASLTNGTCGSYRFSLNHLAKNISTKDWKTIIYCTRHIHGLSLRLLPREKDVFDLNILKPLIKNLYNEHKTKEKCL